jgi:hypothetical protein
MWPRTAGYYRKDVFVKIPVHRKGLIVVGPGEGFVEALAKWSGVVINVRAVFEEETAESGLDGVDKGAELSVSLIFVANLRGPTG